MGIPNATKQEASNAVAALGNYVSLHTSAAGTAGDNEAVGGSYTRKQSTPWTKTGTGTNNGPQVQVFCAAGTYTEGGLFSTSTGATVDAPTNVQVSAQGTGGTFATATYYWTITHTNWRGETTESSEVSASLTGPTASASLSWTNSAGATGTKIYRGTATGDEDTLVATLGAGVGSHVDTGAAGTSTTPPATNTASTFVASNAFAGGEVQVQGTGASLFVTPSITV